MAETVFLGLGSNMGDRAANLSAALSLLGAHPQIQVLRVSPWYQTEPVGYVEQDWFLNCVTKISTSLTPGRLLEAIKAMESNMGRVRGIRWGPRVIDIDILLYGDRHLVEPGLEIPHPRIRERSFVLVPLLDLEPDLVLPSGESGRALLAPLADSGQKVLPWDGPDATI